MFRLKLLVFVSVSLVTCNADTICHDGMYKSGTDCEPCRPNHYCSGGNMYGCVNDKTSPSGSKTISACVCRPGTVQSDETCVTCMESQICSGGNVVEYCPQNTTSPTGSSSSNDCRCKVGFYHENNDDTCQKCPSKRICNGGDAKPDCPGTRISILGTTSIADCVCKPGLLSIGTGSDCNECPVDMFCILGISSRCPLNSFNLPNASSSEECVCRPGFYRNATDSMCIEELCRPGFYRNATDSMCVEELSLVEFIVKLQIAYASFTIDDREMYITGLASSLHVERSVVEIVDVAATSYTDRRLLVNEWTSVNTAITVASNNVSSFTSTVTEENIIAGLSLTMNVTVGSVSVPTITHMRSQLQQNNTRVQTTTLALTTTPLQTTTPSSSLLDDGSKEDSRLSTATLVEIVSGVVAGLLLCIVLIVCSCTRARPRVNIMYMADTLPAPNGSNTQRSQYYYQQPYFP